MTRVTTSTAPHVAGRRVGSLSADILRADLALGASSACTMHSPDDEHSDPSSLYESLCRFIRMPAKSHSASISCQSVPPSDIGSL
jgi:hypothetical protein